MNDNSGKPTPSVLFWNSEEVKFLSLKSEGVVIVVSVMIRVLVSLLHENGLRSSVIIAIGTTAILMNSISGGGVGVSAQFISSTITTNNNGETNTIGGEGTKYGFYPTRGRPFIEVNGVSNSSIVNYLVIAPEIVQPDSIFRVLVYTFVNEGRGIGRRIPKLELSVAIIKDGVNVRSGSTMVTVGQMEATNLRIPLDLTNGTYTLLVEGNHPKSTGGNIFNHVANLTYSEKFLSVLIQTSRHIYNGDSIVRFRAILLQRNLRPYGHPVEVYILDPRGYIMRKWPSVTPKFGVVDLSYALPEYSATGYWNIRVEVGAQVEEKSFRVDRYFNHLYEVVVSMPPFVLATTKTLTATIIPSFGSEKGVLGNGTVKIFAKSRDTTDWLLFGTETFIVDRSYDVTWELKDILRAFTFGSSSTQSFVLRVEANVTDYLVGEMRSGFAESRVVHQTLQIAFITPSLLIFKPGLQFQTYVRVCYSDNQQVSPEVLVTSHLRVTAEVHLESGGRVELTILELSNSTHQFTESYFGKNEFSDFDKKSKFSEYVQNGLTQVKFKVPKRSNRLILKAEYSDASGTFLSIHQRAYVYFSSSSKYINVISTKTSNVIGEYAVFQFTSTFYLDDFHYIVMSKGLILQHSTELMSNPWSVSKTFAIPVSPEMAPGFRILVYHVTQKGEILSDTTFVPVHRFSRHKISLTLNEMKDRIKDSVEMGFLGDAASYIGLSAHRSMRYFLQAGDELSMGGVLRSFYSLEPSTTINRVLTRDRNGEIPDQIHYLQTLNPAFDSIKTFSHANTLFFTNGWSFASHLQEKCETRESCNNGNCFSFINHCGKITACEDQTLHVECELSDNELIAYRINRTNLVNDFYDSNSDGDWGWASSNIGPHGNKYLTLPVPKITDTWHFTAFTVSPNHGFSLIEPVIQYDSTRPFMMALDAPSSIRRGELVGVQAILFNNTPKDIFVTVVLHASPDYNFVQLGQSNGNVDEGKIQLVAGEHHHFVWIAAGGQLEVRIAVKALLEQGSFEVKISAITQIRSDSDSVEISVLPEGAQVGKHTSLVLDLKNRATVLKFLNIYVEESPLNPRDPTRKYIYGSPAAHVTVYGDVLGPIFPSIPVTMNDLIGKAGQGTADRLFDLSVNIWSLHYLRLTNQLKNSVARKVFVEMNKSFTQVMRRFTVDINSVNKGAFKMWDNSQNSVWLSSWALQIFMHGTFQDWENFFIIDTQILSGVTAWLIQNQNLDGTFGEVGVYQYFPLNKKMKVNVEGELGGPFNVTLTAHVAIALHLVIPHLDGSLKLEANLAKYRAIRYLEKHLNQVHDPFQVAILTYILTLADSAEKDAAFSRLFSLRIEDAGFLYWSPGPIPINAFTYENQRPFLQPKNNEYWDSYAVEATSYALMVSLMRDGVTIYAEQIVSWLNSMKLTDGSFISTLDTAVAFQALAEYSNRARLRDITQLSVAIELSSSGNTTGQNIQITPESITTTHVIDIPNVWGHVNVIARGSGQAVVQLDVTYGVDWDELKDTPPKDCFDLQVREYFSVERNKTALTIESCFRWTLLEESSVSGAAVFEMEIPSGYSVVMSDALKLVASGIHPTLHDVLISPGKTSWFFDYIPSEWTCFNHTVRRWYPVANLTASRQATIYEAYALERFQNVILRDMSLKELSICHVCGSFQCPYCPNFSGSHNLFYFASSLLYFFSISLLFIILLL